MRPFACALAFLVVPAARAEDVSSIRAAALLGHVKQLSGDAWKGRGSGTDGERLATDYIAAHFKLVGCEPAGETARSSRRWRCRDA